MQGYTEMILLFALVASIISIATFGVAGNTLWQARRIRSGRQARFSWKWIRIWATAAFVIAFGLLLMAQ